MLRFLPERQFRKIEKLITAFVQGVESTRSDGALLLISVLFGPGVGLDRRLLLVPGPGVCRHALILHL